MEGVGARLGRSSTRYGPATVFNGPVRKWKKRWVHVYLSSHNNHQNNHQSPQLLHNNANGTTTISNGNNNNSNLLLYKWIPLSQTANNKDNDGTPPSSDLPPRRKFKYIPVDLLERQNREAKEKEAAEKDDEEVKRGDAEPIAAKSTSRSDCFDEKPDINDVPKEESQSQGNQVVRQDLNERTLDLNLGLKSHNSDADSKLNQCRE